MKAVVFTQYGPPEVLHIKEVEKPILKANELLIRVYATPVNFGDTLARNFKKISPREFSMPTPLWFPTRLALGLKRPRRTILGSEFAGRVESTGKDVKHFKEGDPVFGYLAMSFGANAEYVCMSEKGMVALKPANMTFEEAATVPYGGLTALSLLKKVNIERDHKILINGASGAIGSHAVQLAKHYGAKVTGVCGTPRIEFVKSLGADNVIDYTKEDFTQNGEIYDLIFDILGKSSFARCRNSLSRNGRYLLASFKTGQLFEMLWTSLVGTKKVICALSVEKPEALAHIKELCEAGAIKSIIDRRFPLDQVAAAHRYIEEGHKQGHVVIVVGRDTDQG